MTACIYYDGCNKWEHKSCASINEKDYRIKKGLGTKRTDSQQGSGTKCNIA